MEFTWENFNLEKGQWKRDLKIMLIGKEILRAGTAELCTTSLPHLCFSAGFRLK